MKKRMWFVTIGVLALAAGIFLLVRKPAVNDAALAAGLIGAWKALDTSNPSLHHRKGGVAAEEVVFRQDGTLAYRIEPLAGQGTAQNDAYSWKVVRGKLELRFLGESSTQDALPRLRFKLNGDRLTMVRRGYAEKVFKKAGS